MASLLWVEGCGTKQDDCMGNTPLAWAAWNGHEEVVKILLERDDINPEKPSESGHTPLCYAAEGGHEGVVELLLERDDVNPEKPGEWG